MTGKSHKLIGVMAGGAIAYYGIVVLKEPLYALAVISTPIGAMLPDIDHNNSRLGSSRKKVFGGLAVLVNILIVVFSAALLAVGYLQGRLVQSLFNLMLLLVPIVLIFLLTRIDFIRSNLQFAVKHRGIMHTLVLPALIYIAVAYISEPSFKILTGGLFVGYMTHIFADLMTTRGCPVLYPISKKNVRFAKIKTGSFWEYAAAFIMIAAILSIILLIQLGGIDLQTVL